MGQPKASIIIPTFNRRVILQKALVALAKSTISFDDFEVVVVDDGSTDDTNAMITALDMPYKLVYERQERKGPASARNRAIGLAQGEIMIFIDSDIVVVPEFVGAHLAVHRQPRVVAVGPVVHTNDLDNPDSASFRITDLSRAFFATGNASVAKQHLLRAGLFDEDFDQYGWEDLELGHRLQKLGLRRVKVPEAIGYHYKEGLTVSSIPKHRQRERERGRMAVVFYEKDPCWTTRLQVEMSPIMFGLDRLLTIGNWPDAKGTQRLLEFFEARGWSWSLRFVVRLITHHDYMEGMREALRERKLSHRNK
jgi:glycosyltransferase involved in cell wall biosynthesis